MKYELFNVVFESENLVCPICGSHFILENKNDVNKIKSCSDLVCGFNKIHHYKKRKLVYPSDVYKSYCKSATVTHFSVEYWLKKGFSEEEAKLQISMLAKKGSEVGNKVLTEKQLRPTKANIVKDSLALGSTREEAELKAKEFFDGRSCFTKDFWQKKGLSEEESVEKVRQIQTTSSKRLRELMTANPEKYIGTQTSQLEYWLNKGLSEDEAKAALKERQTTFSLEKCILKYGEEEGQKKFQDRQDKWKAKIFDKYGTIAQGLSKISKDFVDSLIKNYPDNIQQEFFYGKNEKFIKDISTKKAYKYDFTYKNKIIEFNGDFWHCNPEKYGTDKINYPGLGLISPQEIWDRDENKILIAKKYNYDVLIIWESEFNKSPEEVIKKCMNFLQIEI